MVNKPKIQGTRFETQTKELLQSWGYKAYRLAEGGMADEGDVQVELPEEMIEKHDSDGSGTLDQTEIENAVLNSNDFRETTLDEWGDE